MCWNQYVSINTFLFGIFTLWFIKINNTYSDYKIDFFKNEYVYLFILSIVLMQLIEFFLWINIHNKSINHNLSILGFLLLVVQPITALYLIKDITLRNNLLTFYGIFASIFVVFNMQTTYIHTKITSQGFLSWNWTQHTLLSVSFYLFFLFFPLLYNQYYISLIFLFIFFALIHYIGKGYGSLWCLFVNSMFIYFLIELLVIQPFNQVLETTPV